MFVDALDTVAVIGKPPPVAVAFTTNSTIPRLRTASDDLVVDGTTGQLIPPVFSASPVVRDRPGCKTFEADCSGRVAAIAAS
jgi:hypothetical protein